MIKCSECGYENMDGLDYCDGCGAKLAAPARAVVAIPKGKRLRLWAIVRSVDAAGGRLTVRDRRGKVRVLLRVSRVLGALVDRIGRAVSWLCSDRAKNVTGQVIAVDGGITLGSRAER